MSEPDLDAVEQVVDAATTAQGDRYEQLVAAHDAVRDALTDDDAQATGR
jgi:hypothetical protein